MKLELTKEEIKFLRVLILRATLGGGLIDIAHHVKDELERHLDAKDFATEIVVEKPKR